jgi:hypothetical protein
MPVHEVLQASFRFKIQANNLMQDTTSSYSRFKISTQAQLRPDHVALQASFRLKIRAHTLMKDTAFSY